MSRTAESRMGECPNCGKPATPHKVRFSCGSQHTDEGLRVSEECRLRQERDEARKERDAMQSVVEAAVVFGLAEDEQERRLAEKVLHRTVDALRSQNLHTQPAPVEDSYLCADCREEPCVCSEESHTVATSSPKEPEDNLFLKRFPHMEGYIGTHYADCYKNHPACAWRLGYEDGLNRTSGTAPAAAETASHPSAASTPAANEDE